MTTHRCLTRSCLLVSLIASATMAAKTPPAEKTPAWATAHVDAKPMTADETKAFMKRLARYVFENHLKTDPKSPQRGMVYEYFHVARKGKPDQWVQGEALDTMHDGAWFAAAMVNAFRATGDGFYKDFLTKWQLPFYLKMLNHSNELFVSSAKRNDARKGATPWGKPWAFQDGEKGFIPYFWDDGASVSLERRTSKNPLGSRPCVDLLAGEPNPEGRLSGYSQGMSNHMAQDIGVMVQLAWLAFKDSTAPADRKLAAELADGAKNLHASRMRHHGAIPMCVAPAALAGADAALMKRLPDPTDARLWSVGRHYTQALRDYKPAQRCSGPGFADDQQFRYYCGIARTGGKLPRALAFKIVADACTEARLWRCYSDDAPVPAGINRFDLFPGTFVDGKPQHYRSDRKGPGGRPLPVGSRMGPQNMICCGWALQVLRTMPGIWEEPYRRKFSKDLRVYFTEAKIQRLRDGTIAPPAIRSRVLTPAAKAGGVDLGIASSRSALWLWGTCKAETATVRVFSRPDATGTHAVLTVKKGAKPVAVNDRGDALILDGGCWPREQGFAFSVVLPYTMAKGQKRWANGVEHGRYSIQVGQETRNLYLASREQDVKAWLEHELAGGLRTWEAIFNEVGYIPTGIGTGRFWDGYSDSGGYAHLVSAAAQWLLCLEGKNDWDLHNIPRVIAGK